MDVPGTGKYMEAFSCSQVCTRSKTQNSSQCISIGTRTTAPYIVCCGAFSVYLV